MKRLTLILLLFPAIAFAQDFTVLRDAAHALKSSREIAARNDLGTVPSGWPCAGYVTSPFGYRTHPISHRWSHHNGIDIAYRKGTKIRATGGGTVVFCERGWHRGYTGYGLIVVVKHSPHVYTMYAHLDSIAVEKGDTVTRGDIVGTMGSTGRSTGPHLHYEIRVDGKAVDPEGWME